MEFMRRQIFNRFMSLLLLSAVLFSCVESTSGNKRKSSTKSNSTGATTNTGSPVDPSFSNNLNFIQNGSIQTSSTFDVAVDFQASFYLRGGQVNSFINKGVPSWRVK